VLVFGGARHVGAGYTYADETIPGTQCIATLGIRKILPSTPEISHEQVFTGMDTTHSMESLLLLSGMGEMVDIRHARMFKA